MENVWNHRFRVVKATDLSKRVPNIIVRISFVCRYLKIDNYIFSFIGFLRSFYLYIICPNNKIKRLYICSVYNKEYSNINSKFVYLNGAMVSSVTSRGFVVSQRSLFCHKLPPVVHQNAFYQLVVI